MADIVVTVAVVVCRIPSGTPGSRYQSLRKKCNRIVRSSGSKSMSSSKSLLISDQLVFGMIIGMIGFDTHTHVYGTHTHTHTHTRTRTGNGSRRVVPILVQVCVRFFMSFHFSGRTGYATK